MLKPDSYRDAFQKSHQILLLADCNYNVLDANESAIRQLGYTVEEFKKMSVPDLFFHEEQGKKFTQEICIKDNVINWEYLLKRKDGQAITALLTGDKISEEGNIYLLSAQNIGEIRKETTAVIRKNELTATKSMNHLIVHELKNLSYGIGLAADELKDSIEKIPKYLSDSIDYIEENNMRLGKTIKSLLEFDKSFDLNFTLLNINEIIEEAIETNRNKFKLMDIQLKVNLTKNEFFYPIDRDKLLMAFNNIINNAIESILNKDGIICISSKSANQKSIVRISDNGIGMNKDERTNLFKPFYTTKPKGNGMGLYTAREILLGHQIGFYLESEKETGSTFSLYFDRKNLEPNT
ncbi:PAS domain-containing sensor histidine kinase [Cyclobacterium sp.]|uniref:sensor histidine kinase n=1 Tax=Cyclobacterium sp. TaxID=1966343 RepID=UPI0019B31953|nr:PAS domain-containing sensor histidine kinase [Cyclobacterium sp.]MBD3630089.1 PAS domain-containing sensor histidine kinase [Cyclobacterium sp.]